MPSVTGLLSSSGSECRGESDSEQSALKASKATDRCVAKQGAWKASVGKNGARHLRSADVGMHQSVRLHRGSRGMPLDSTAGKKVTVSGEGPGADGPRLEAHVPV